MDEIYNDATAHSEINGFSQIHVEKIQYFLKTIIHAQFPNKHHIEMSTDKIMFVRPSENQNENSDVRTFGNFRLNFAPENRTKKKTNIRTGRPKIQYIGFCPCPLTPLCVVD